MKLILHIFCKDLGFRVQGFGFRVGILMLLLVL